MRFQSGRIPDFRIGVVESAETIWHDENSSRYDVFMAWVIGLGH